MSFETWRNTATIVRGDWWDPEYWAKKAWEAAEAELLTPMECGHPKTFRLTENCNTPECLIKDHGYCVICELDKVKAGRDTLTGRITALRKLLWLNHARYAPYLHLPYGGECCFA